MRWLGVLIVALIFYVAVPLLWQRAMVAEVNQISKEPSPIPTVSAVSAFDANMTIDMNTMHPAVTINSEEYERIGVQSQVDQQMHQVQAAQDAAYRAQHPGGY